MDSELPKSVRYVKNGPGGKWWPESKANGQIHLGWKSVPKDLLLKPDLSQIERLYRNESAEPPGPIQDFKALETLLNAPSRHIWITFEEGCMWWCTVHDGAQVNPDGEGTDKGNFWLTCDQRHPWLNKSVKGKLLVMRDLPGQVTRTAGFRATVCQPKGWEAIIRLIQDEMDLDVVKSSEMRGTYKEAIQKLVERLQWQDFEQLIQFILDRTGWSRISSLNPVREGVDVEAQNPATGEIAFVQIKSEATQNVLNNYVGLFRERNGYYARLIFAVHTPKGILTVPADTPPVHLWTGDQVADLVVRLGLGEWIESRFA